MISRLLNRDVDVRRLRLKPGDTIVVTLDTNPDLDHINELWDELNRTFPDNKVVLLGRGARLEVVGA